MAGAAKESSRDKGAGDRTVIIMGGVIDVCTK